MSRKNRIATETVASAETVADVEQMEPIEQIETEETVETVEDEETEDEDDDVDEDETETEETTETVAVDPMTKNAEQVAALALSLGFPEDRVSKAVAALMHATRTAVYKWRGAFTVGVMLRQLTECGFRMNEYPEDVTIATKNDIDVDWNLDGNGIKYYGDDLLWLIACLKAVPTGENIIASGSDGKGAEYRLILSTEGGKELCRVKQTGWSRTLDEKIALQAKRDAAKTKEAEAKKATLTKAVAKLEKLAGKDAVAELLAKYQTVVAVK